MVPVGADFPEATGILDTSPISLPYGLIAADTGGRASAMTVS